MESVLSLLPKKIHEQLQHISPAVAERIEELRIRIGRPLEIIVGGKPSFMPYLVDAGDAQALLSRLSQFSLYTLEEELKRGYITVAGGHRVGLAGKVILENGGVKAIRDISSFNIRIARQKIGAAEELISFLYTHEWQHTMIIGAPQSGKTTLLRDIARIISSGSERYNILPNKVGIVDERSEIAGCVQGVPQLEFGPRVDVLDGCPKAEGMMMMIRSMSPDVLVVDEIGRAEDTLAVLEAVNAGIKLIITTHGQSLEEIRKRPTIAAILEQSIFERFIELKRSEDQGRISTVFDGGGRQISKKAGSQHV
ncbi:stage III sporulation protein AA [Peribacillus cavernae]|uniref:Stage III sporulation protein AA n=1 Tax=Peribacillus cavernae TaxID=1674310 RepID=A0A3S0TWR9_9BACI|nr:stage III sporulation protein AA [Peribacillus cavernae]MDQ0220812.1 stage III sporulation protein AA [Peribacillus cavernae]RUQ24762.1 stage III sporulation protein AA [Peribacillus cavernae]